MVKNFMLYPYINLQDFINLYTSITFLPFLFLFLFQIALEILFFYEEFLLGFVSSILGKKESDYLNERFAEVRILVELNHQGTHSLYSRMSFESKNSTLQIYIIIYLYIFYIIDVYFKPLFFMLNFYSFLSFLLHFFGKQGIFFSLFLMFV